MIRHVGANMSINNYISAFKKPQRVWTRAEIFCSPCPVPMHPGVYAWYFKNFPPNIPVTGCADFDGSKLLYVGISPKRPPKNGKPPSRQRLYNRVRYHMSGNAAGSTLRLTIGCLLADRLGIELRRVGSGERLTFADGEQKVSDWLSENAIVTWVEYAEPWELESKLFSELSLPLNLQGNRHHAFHAELSALRKMRRELARSLPILR